MPIGHGGRWLSALGDMVHTPLFCCVTLGALFLLQRLSNANNDRRQIFRRCLVVATTLFLFGVCMEFAQKWSGRTGDIHDAVANGVGILIGVAIYLWFWRETVCDETCRGHRHFKSILIGISVTALTATWWRPIITLMDERKLQNEFPILCDFDSNIELTRWFYRESSGKITRQDNHAGSTAMRFALPKDFSSVTLVAMNPNWSQMETLELDLLLPADQETNHVHVLLSVLDQQFENYDTDLFEKTWELPRGEWVHVVLHRDEIVAGPRDRKLDLSQVQYFTIGLADHSAPIELAIDTVKLTLKNDG
jgi:hypothetical protein